MKRVLFACLMLLGLSACDHQDDAETVTIETNAQGQQVEHHCSNGHCTWVPIHADAVAPHAAVVVVPSAFIPQPVTAAPSGTGIKRAVLVGINKFQNPGAPELSGCVNDARNIQKKAIASWGFTPDCIITLIDEEATVANVKAALTDAVNSSKPGDTVLYWQSSHGATDNDPVTGELYDLVCCYDFDWDAAHELTSKDFKAIFGAAAKGVYIGWGSDSCHSGDLDKNVGHHKHRVRAKSPVPPEAVRLRVAKAEKNGAKSRSITDGVLDVALIAGCKSDETSADSSDDQGVPCGAFTNQFLLDIDAMQNATMKELAKKLDADLKAQGYDQTPVTSGSYATKPWLKP